MPGADGRINVALLAMPEVTASALFGMFDLFSAPGRDWSFIMEGAPGVQRMNPYIVARDRADFSAANGIAIRPDHALADCPPPDIVCIPDFFVDPGEMLTGRYDPEAAWLKAVHGQGAYLCSACSGAVLLGEAGFLDGAEATIHWGYVRTLINNYPKARISLDRSLVMTGEAQRIVMAGAAPVGRIWRFGSSRALSAPRRRCAWPASTCCNGMTWARRPSPRFWGGRRPRMPRSASARTGWPTIMPPPRPWPR